MMILRETRNKYNIDYSKISFYQKKLNLGPKLPLSAQLETCECNKLIVCVQEYPITLYELQKIIADYLTNNGIAIPRFTRYYRPFLQNDVGSHFVYPWIKHKGFQTHSNPPQITKNEDHNNRNNIPPFSPNEKKARFAASRDDSEYQDNP